MEILLDLEKLLATKKKKSQFAEELTTADKGFWDTVYLL